MSDEKNVSRREVLKKGSLASAFAFAMPVSVARAIEAAQDPKAAAADEARAAKRADKVRIAWIGSGTQGRNDLSKLVRMPDVEIVAIADIFPPNLELGTKMAGPQCQGYSDYRKMLERKDIDGVGIATPLYLHAPMAVDVLESGKNVYVEKLMAYTVEDAKKIVRTADRTGKLLQVGHQRRYSVDYHHALDLLAKKQYFGEITQVRAEWNRRNNWRRPLPKDTAGLDAKEMDKLWNWRLYKSRSRGLMAELGSHQLDVSNWFMGQYYANSKNKDAKTAIPAGHNTDLHPIAVVGLGGIDYWKDGREVNDNVQVVFEYPTGQKLIYQSIETNQYLGFSETFMGRNGTLITSEEKGRSMMFREPGVEEFGFEKFSENKTKVGKNEAIVLDAGATTKQDKRGATAGQALAGADGAPATKDNWYLSLEDWVDCIRTNRKPFCDGRVGLADVACVIAANEAMDKGRRIEIPASVFEV
jgi:predicted dehydrogenase